MLSTVCCATIHSDVGFGDILLIQTDKRHSHGAVFMANYYLFYYNFIFDQMVGIIAANKSAVLCHHSVHVQVMLMTY
jgi:hypothetical protein